MRFFTTVTDAPDLKRRAFLFGAGAVAASLIMPAPKSFFIVKPPPLIIPTPERPFDLPMQQMLSLLKKLEDQMVEMSDIPRWVVVDKQWYDQMVAAGK